MNPVTTSMTVACPACQGDRLRDLGQKHSHTMLSCSRCGVLFAAHAPRGGIEGLYDAHYTAVGFTPPPPSVQRSLERVVSSAERFRQTGQWLDLGFGQGTLLGVTERHGWKCFGTELSEPALEHGRHRGWLVSRDPSHDARFAPGAFDVVTAIELLEHLGDPGYLVAEAHRWLRPGGLLYLTTPNAMSLNRRVLGIRWSVVSPPDHAVLWTARALRALLRKAGFRVDALSAEGHNPSELLAVLRRAPLAGVDRARAGVALSEQLGRNRRGAAIKTVANAVLNVLALGDTLKVRAVRDHRG